MKIGAVTQIAIAALYLVNALPGSGQSLDHTARAAIAPKTWLCATPLLLEQQIAGRPASETYCWQESAWLEVVRADTTGRSVHAIDQTYRDFWVAASGIRPIGEMRTGKTSPPPARPNGAKASVVIIHDTVFVHDTVYIERGARPPARGSPTYPLVTNPCERERPYRSWTNAQLNAAMVEAMGTDAAQGLINEASCRVAGGW